MCILTQHLREQLHTRTQLSSDVLTCILNFVHKSRIPFPSSVQRSMDVVVEPFFSWLTVLQFPISIKHRLNLHAVDSSFLKFERTRCLFYLPFPSLLPPLVSPLSSDASFTADQAMHSRFQTLHITASLSD